LRLSCIDVNDELPLKKKNWVINNF
jgi:hypothetical protein